MNLTPLFCVDHRVDRPPDDLYPAEIVRHDSRSVRSAGNQPGQDEVIGGIGGTRAQRRERRLILAERITASSKVRVGGLLEPLDDDRREGQLVLAEIVGDVDLVGRSRLHANRRAVEVLDRLHIGRLADDEGRAVVPVDRGELDAELDVALKRDRRDARQDVYLAGLKRGEPLRRSERREPDLARVAEHRGRDRAAHVDVEAPPLALRIRRREPGDAGGHAALHEVLAAHGVERRRGGRSRLHVGGRDHRFFACRARARGSRTTDEQPEHEGSKRAPNRLLHGFYPQQPLRRDWRSGFHSWRSRVSEIFAVSVDSDRSASGGMNGIACGADNKSAPQTVQRFRGTQAD